MRVALIACWLFATPLHAAHPLITEDTGTLGEGRWQLELYGEAGEARGTGARMDRDDAVLGYGLTPDLDLQAGVPWIRERASGMGDITLDLKWRFLERGAFSLGLKPGVSLPTGDERKGLGAGRVGWGALLIASYEPGEVAFHAHAGFKRHRNSIGERQSLTHFSGAVAVQAAPGFKVVADLARNTSADPAATRSERYFVFGVIWSVTRDVDLDFGFKAGHGGAALDEALLLGLTARW